MSTAVIPSAQELFLLVETAAGYLLAHVKQWDELCQETDGVLASLEDFGSFREVAEMKAFHPFPTAEEALHNMQSIAAGEVTDTLRNFLDLNLPKKKKKRSSGIVIGVTDPTLGKALSDLGFPAYYNQNCLELARACRVHIRKWAPPFHQLDLHKFQVGLGHSYSRNKIQFDPARQDKPVTQSIALVDSLDKNTNTFAMRVREWYGWHFPELSSIVSDNQTFCQVARIIGVKEHFDPEALCSLKTPHEDSVRFLQNDTSLANTSSGRDRAAEEEADSTMAVEQESSEVEPKSGFNGMREAHQDEDRLSSNRDALVRACGGSSEVVEDILSACNHSVGQEITEMDMLNIDRFALEVLKLCSLRAKLADYLSSRLDVVAPNLKTLVGDVLAARLISHAGSLVNLAKTPASTIQILGAEKALFRALKTKGNTPKYGLLFQSSFIGRAAQKSKGRISRYLANKCSLAARIDTFAPTTSAASGSCAPPLLPDADGKKTLKKKSKKKKHKEGESLQQTVVVDKLSPQHKRNVFGEKMREQVEERLRYLSSGGVTRKNIDVMKEALGELQAAEDAR